MGEMIVHYPGCMRCYGKVNSSYQMGDICKNATLSLRSKQKSSNLTLVVGGAIGHGIARQF